MRHAYVVAVTELSMIPPVVARHPLRSSIPFPRDIRAVGQVLEVVGRDHFAWTHVAVGCCWNVLEQLEDAATAAARGATGNRAARFLLCR
jgi:hypothetical protein